MDPYMHDTSPEAYEAQIKALRRMTPTQRLEMALEMSAQARQTAIDGVLAANPELSEREALLVVARRMYGDELIDAAFGKG